MSLKSLAVHIDSAERANKLVEYAKGVTTEELHVLVDGLCMVLNNNAEPTQALHYAWPALIGIATTSQLFAHTRTINSHHLSPTDDTSVYTIQGNPSKLVKVLRRAKKDESKLCQELIYWAHLSHPNIVPLYATFFEGDNQPSFLSPHLSNNTISTHALSLDQPERMRLILDVAAGLDYMHQAGAVHGRLIPEVVLIADDGRAVITALDSRTEMGGWDSIPARYSAPEVLIEEDASLTKEIDVWSFGCLAYKLLSGKYPYFEISRERRVITAISRGDKPARPGRGEIGGHKIADAVWHELLACWSFEAGKRPSSSQIHQALLGAINFLNHSPSKLTIHAGLLETSTVDLERAEVILTKALALSTNKTSDVTIPDHVQAVLSRLTLTSDKKDATWFAARKLSPSDTQTLVDLLDLAVKDLPPKDLHPFRGNHLARLVSDVMDSTHIVPQSYKLNGLQFNPADCIAENNYAKAYKARGMNVRVNLVTDTYVASDIYEWLAVWANLSHPNILPLHGIFNESQSGSPQLCVVTPSLRTLCDYAPTLPQKSRLPLLSDVVHGLMYLHTTLSYQVPGGWLSTDGIVISEEGRAMILGFYTQDFPTAAQIHFQYKGYRERFNTPFVFEARDKWAFGLVCYETLSKKPPYHEKGDKEAKTASEQGELPTRPDYSEDGMDEIDDEGWNLMTRCCAKEEDDLPTIEEIQAMVDKMIGEDGRPTVQPLMPAHEILALRSRPKVDFTYAEVVLNKIEAETLRRPLKKLLRYRTKDVAIVAAALKRDEVRNIVDFLDQLLKEHLTIADERNRVLGLLSRITSLTHIFPRRYELKGVKYRPQVIAEGGFGKVYRGVDSSICVKMMFRLDPKVLMPWIKEVILWAHSSHPNVLPFYGVFLEKYGNTPQMCLVLPFIKNGDLHSYAPRLPQTSRLPLISDVVEGLHYLHGLGNVHGDLKGQNILISDEGRALITDFGTSHVKTATAASGQLSATMLRFSAPEAISGNKTPSKEFDIWSLGCLKYEILSKKEPYHQYKFEMQIIGALLRGELPLRPGTKKAKDVQEEETDEWGRDDDCEDNGDMIDDQAWALIVNCCSLNPKDRPTIQAVRELVVDLKIWDDRPAAKPILSGEISKLKSTFNPDLSRMEELLAEIQRKVDAAKSAVETPAPALAASS